MKLTVKMGCTELCFEKGVVERERFYAVCYLIAVFLVGHGFLRLAEIMVGG